MAKKIYTNTGKTKAEIILELVETLNIGNYNAYNEDRVNYAIRQYEILVNKGVIQEIGD